MHCIALAVHIMILTMHKLQSVHERNAREVQTQQDNAIAVQNYTVTDTYTIGLVAAVNIGTNASIDRFDSTLGYIPGNVVFCTSLTNSMKLDMGFEEFLVQFW